MGVYTGTVKRRQLLGALHKLCSRHRYAGGENIFVFTPRPGMNGPGAKVVVGRHSEYGPRKLAIVVRALRRAGITPAELYSALGVRTR